MTPWLWWVAACAPKIDPGPIPADVARAPVRLITQPVADAPDVYFAAIVAAGSAWDAVGGEGTASLVARSLVEAGAGDRSSEEVREALFPTGNTFEVVVDREWASIRLRCHRDQAAVCAELFADALVRPRFDENDVIRLRDDAVRDVTDGLLANEEALGQEVLEASVYAGHPYGHPPEGRAGVLPLITADDLRTFHTVHYVRQAVVAGIAGGFDDDVVRILSDHFESLPQEMAPQLVLMKPPKIVGRSVLAVDTETPVTGISFGQPMVLDRNDPDWAAMLVATTALGAHRQSFGRLFRSLRGDRGLNYGDYAYVEPYVQRRGTSQPDQGVLRTQNLFRVWIRPTSIENGPFALKLAIDEVERWVATGLSPEEFSDTRAYLRSGLPLLAPDPGRRLVYALDALATGTPDPFDVLPAALDALTVEEVNAAIPRHVDPANLRIVAVSGEAQAFVDRIAEQSPTAIVYADGAADPSRTLRDTEVSLKNLGIATDQQWVVDAQGVFR